MLINDNSIPEATEADLVSSNKILIQTPAGTKNGAADLYAKARDTLSYKVLIDGKYYDCVIIGSKLWMAENLAMPFGVLGTDYDWQGNSENQSELMKYGCRYKPSSVLSGNGTMSSTFAEKLPSGWRIPGSSDYDDLKSQIGGNQAGKLRAVSDSWSDYNGEKPIRDNVFGFNAFPSGLNDQYFGQGFAALTSVIDGSKNHYIRIWYNSENVSLTSYSDNRFCSIRLVLDLVNEQIPSGSGVVMSTSKALHAPSGCRVPVIKDGAQCDVDSKEFAKCIPQIESNLCYSHYLAGKFVGDNSIPLFPGNILPSGDLDFSFSSSYKHVFLKLVPGQQVKITGSSNNSSVSIFYVFDENFNLIQDGGNTSRSNYIFTASAACWLAVNAYVNNPSWVYSVSLIGSLGSVTYSSSNINNRKSIDFHEGGYITPSGGVDSPSSGEYFKYAVVPILKGEKYIITAHVYGVVRAILFFNSSKVLVSQTDAAVNYDELEFVAEEDGFLCVNSVSAYAYTELFPFDYYSALCKWFGQIALIKDNTANNFNFFLANDLHGNLYAAKCIKELKKYFDMPAISCGDVAPVRPTTYDFSDFILLAKAIEMYFTIGQHEVGFMLESDGNAGRLKANCWTHQQVFDNLISPMKSTWGLPNLSTNYWFKDFTDEKVRLISLYQYNIPLVDDPEDSDYYKYKREVVWYGQEQINWFVNALKDVPEDYTVIIIKHQPDMSCRKTGSRFGDRNIGGNNLIIDGTPIEDIVNAYMNKTSISQEYVCVDTETYPVTDFKLSVDNDFSSAEGSFGFYVMGDTHIDCVSKTKDYPQRTMVITSSSTPQDTSVAWQMNYENALLLNILGVNSSSRNISLVRIGQQSSYKLEDRSKELVPMDFD